VRQRFSEDAQQVLGLYGQVLQQFEDISLLKTEKQQTEVGEDMVDQSLRPIKIFYCYAPEDRALQEKLAGHLSPLRRLRDITTWVDRDIQAGAEWQREQEAHLETADLLLLLISADFMASDYCYTVGMKRALERHQAGTAHVIPILLRPVEWQKTPLGGLSALPTGNKPVTQWTDRDAAWLDIVQGIHEVVRTFLPKRLLPPQTAEVLYPKPEKPFGERTGLQPAGRMLHQRYRLLHSVGQGGMGAVYVARDTQLGDRLVAVKEMSTSRLFPQDLPRAVEQFRREAYLLASLHHPNLPVIHEYFHEDDRWYLVMSFIEGQNLQVALNAMQGNRLPVNEVVRIGIELCEVLDYLHTHNPQIIFRDLKPLNIMLTPKGHIYLIDFGIARHFKQEQTKDTTSYYSVGYAPPEQYGQSQAGPRSDIYSLGATLHQMLSGYDPASKPFQFPNLQLVDPALPASLVKLVTQMLDMDEQARPANVAEVKERLEKIFDTNLLVEVGPVKPEPVKGTEKELDDRKKKSRFFSNHLSGAASLPHPNSRVKGKSFIAPRVIHALARSRKILRIIAWLCFIVVILILGWKTGTSLIFFDSVFYSGGFGGFPLFWSWFGVLPCIASIGAAAVGLVFLLTKRRSHVDIIGGIVLTTCGSLVPPAFASPTVNECFSTVADVQRCLPFQTSMLTYSVLLLLLIIPLLLLGTYFFLRSANMVGRLIFAAMIIMVGMLLEYLLETNGQVLTHQSGYYLSTPIPIIWLPFAILGIAAIVITFIVHLQNKSRTQTQKA
jgi:serine/threonine protein kinase